MTANKPRIKAWVEALRSGEYAQGKYALTAVNEDGKMGYCCLGVACELAVRADPALGDDLNSRYYFDVLDQGNFWVGGVMVQEVRDWYGLGDELGNGDIHLIDPAMGYITRSAAELNDTYGYDFPKIADAIEETFLKEN